MGESNLFGFGFSKILIKTAINYLIENCYFNVGNMAIKQEISISMGIDPAPFWAILFLYSYEEAYMSSLISSDKIKARHFLSTKRFNHDLCTINDDVDGEFKRSIRDMYRMEFEVKVKH